MVKFITAEQGTREWFEARLGIPTASNLDAILTKGGGKTRLSYMRKLAAEIITNGPLENFSTYEMERGKVMEPEARNVYQFLADTPVLECGFAVNDLAGASPDGLIGEDGILEIKTKRPDLLIEVILSGEVPKEHLPQIQCQLWVTERKWCDFVAYYSGMEPFIKRVYRDEAYISAMAEEVEKFVCELTEMVATVRAYKAKVQHD